MEEIIEDIPTEDRVQIYVKFNEDKTYGFYHVEEHGEDITGDKSYIPITDEGYQTLMDNQGDLVIGELPADVTEIGVEHLVEVPEQEPLPPTEEEQKWEQTEMVLQMFARSLPDEEALKVPLVFAEWQPGIDYEVGDVVRYGEKLYRVYQPHPSQDDWLPPDAPALYVRVAPPGVIPEWRQPTGAHDTYGLGARVIYDNKIYESKIEANDTTPGSDERWWEFIEDLTPEEPIDPENPEEPTDPEEPVDPEPEEPTAESWEDRWSINQTGYVTGDVVTHNGFYWTSKVGAPGNWNIHEPSVAAHAAWEKGDSVV